MNTKLLHVDRPRSHFIKPQIEEYLHTYVHTFIEVIGLICRDHDDIRI